MTDQPFLRSPPFPGVDPARAAVSQAQSISGENPRISEALFVQLAQARVGGTFWGEPVRGATRVARAGVPVAPAVMDGLARGALMTVRSDAQYDPWTLLEGVEAVHADPADELALIAGLLEIPVFGPDGARASPDRLRALLADRIAGVTYRNCYTGESASIEEAIDWLALWRDHFDANRDIAGASGMAFWKKEAVRTFLWNGHAATPFLSPKRGLARARRTNGALAIWPSRVPADLEAAAGAAGVPIVRVEDGFLRSRGLGAALHPPGSLVVDRTGIYYDARGASDLETLLATHDFPSELVARAAALRDRVCASGVTKYGVQAGRLADLPQGRRTVLAVGQVDDDKSVEYGGAGIVGNLAFLERVRAAEPDAWILYRPHPDVQAGHRRGYLSDADVLAHADAIDSGSPLMNLVRAVDEVHVLSSLTGFEALMRGCAVTVHGMPFYADWGVTRDLAPPTGRRGRKLTVDQIVAAAFILYPRYRDPVTGLPCSAERMVDRMTDGSTPRITWLIRLRTLQGRLKRSMDWILSLFHG